MTKRINVDLGARSYEIVIEFDLLGNLDEILKPWNTGQKWVMLSQEGQAKRHGNKACDLLKKKGYDINMLMLPDGEDAKSLEVVESVYNSLIEMNCDKSTTLLAFGGGVVGDAAGFVAATFMRGIPYFQVPTTLLSMVDSAIGGKTGVNLSHGKNLVGAIYQPLGVLIDPKVVDTLPEREIISGLGEVFKYGAIWDKEFYFYLEKNFGKLVKRDKGCLEYAIEKACRIKTEVVMKDEFESDLRRVLNFGHTLGHAIEKCGNFNEFRHGEAVIIGMLGAAFISNRKGLLSDEDLENFIRPLKNITLPDIKNIDTDCILKTIRQDKKVHSGKLHYILLDGIGSVKVDTTVTHEEILEAWGKL